MFQSHCLLFPTVQKTNEFEELTSYTVKLFAQIVSAKNSVKRSGYWDHLVLVDYLIFIL